MAQVHVLPRRLALSRTWCSSVRCRLGRGIDIDTGCGQLRHRLADGTYGGFILTLLATLGPRSRAPGPAGATPGSGSMGGQDGHASLALAFGVLW